MHNVQSITSTTLTMLGAMAHESDKLCDGLNMGMLAE